VSASNRLEPGYRRRLGNVWLNRKAAGILCLLNFAVWKNVINSILFISWRVL
jgi:hypothetical protein